MDILHYAEFNYDRKKSFSLSFIEESKKRRAELFTDIMKVAEEQFGDTINIFDQISFSGITEPVTHSSLDRHITINLPEYLLHCGQETHTKYQLAHEAIHWLSKSHDNHGKENKVSVLEEGIAVCFSEKYVSSALSIHPNDKDYLMAGQLVRKLLEKDKYFIKKLRTKQPIISLITAQDIIDIDSTIPKDLAEKLGMYFYSPGWV